MKERLFLFGRFQKGPHMDFRGCGGVPRFGWDGRHLRRNEKAPAKMWMWEGKGPVYAGSR